MRFRGRMLTAALALAGGLTACGGDTTGPGFTPVPGITGKLAYVTLHEQSYKLHILDFQTGVMRTIHTSFAAEAIWPGAWYPDGHSLIVQWFSLSSGYRLYRMNEDGTGFAQVYATGNNFTPAYSPQGALAYCSYVPSSDPQAPRVEGLFVNGGLILPNACDVATGISWFPDGRAIALASWSGLYRLNLATKTATLLLVGSFRGAAVSPKGDMIAVDAVDQAGDTIWLVQADGSDSQVLVSGAAPQWSADASRLMFYRGSSLYVRELATGQDAKIGDYAGALWYP